MEIKQYFHGQNLVTRKARNKGNEFNLFPFLYASFVKAPAGRALEEVARLVVTEGLIFHKNMEFLILIFGKGSKYGICDYGKIN